MNIISKLAVFGLFLLGLISCDDDDAVNSPIVRDGNLLISTGIANPDGMSGLAFLQLIDDLEPKSLTNLNAFPAPYSNVTCIYGNDVYVLPGFGGETQLVKYTRTDGELVKTGEYTLTENSSATNAVIQGDFLYVSCQFIGKILVLKHADMSLVKEIDISSYGVGDQNPDPASMIIRGNLLYIGLSQAVGGFFPDENRPYVDVLIINTDNNQVEKMITSTTPGISTPTRPIDPKSIFMDENNDIYVTCVGGFGAVPGHHAGILRIKAEETDFDSTYYFDLSTTSIEGESNKLDYLHMVKYHKNGKLYATANIPAYYGNPVNPLKDRTVVPIEIDLAAKTMKTLGLPYSNSIGRATAIYQDIVVFGLATNSDNGLYTYNPSTKESSKNALVTTEGFPGVINTFD